MVRTMECRKALPRTVMTSRCSPITCMRSKAISSTRRMVVFPSALTARQKLLKSCSPMRVREAWAMATTSKGFGTCQEKSFMKMGGVGSVQMK